MTKRKSTKLPPASDWQSRNIDDWNTTTFHAYMQSRHRELFGCEYAPFRSWQVEQGMIGRLIGTRSRAGTHDKALIKRFIDEAFATYKPTAQYPGTNFGFIYSYRRNILQRLEFEERTRIKRKESTKPQQTAEELDDMAEWL